MQNGKRTIEVIRKQSLHTLGPYHRADLLTTLRDFNLNRNASRWGGGGVDFDRNPRKVRPGTQWRRCLHTGLLRRHEPVNARAFVLCTRAKP